MDGEIYAVIALENLLSVKEEKAEVTMLVDALGLYHELNSNDTIGFSNMYFRQYCARPAQFMLD
ncbi:MAG: hypothetical protein GX236_10360 [Clostridiaceae bacterium]|jgi:hypothetical protein|nr:hypothetical protein [Clostridiaceae bacterium]